MPTPVGPPAENPAIPHLYMYLYRNRKAKKNLSNHSKKVVK